MQRPGRWLSIVAALVIAGTSGAALADHPASGTTDPDRIFGIDPTPDDCAETVVANQALGGLLGGVVGGLIGSGIGKGSGKTAATIGGAVLGAIGGAALGGRTAEAGEACLAEPDPDYVWQNPDAPASGEPIRLIRR